MSGLFHKTTSAFKRVIHSFHSQKSWSELGQWKLFCTTQCFLEGKKNHLWLSVYKKKLNLKKEKRKRSNAKTCEFIGRSDTLLLSYLGFLTWVGSNKRRTIVYKTRNNTNEGFGLYEVFYNSSSVARLSPDRYTILFVVKNWRRNDLKRPHPTSCLVAWWMNMLSWLCSASLCGPDLQEWVIYRKAAWLTFEHKV